MLEMLRVEARAARAGLRQWSTTRTWSRFARAHNRLEPGSFVSLGEFTVCVNDGPNFAILCKDIFEKRIYHFESDSPGPVIIDCGSNIGMSILYFKKIYPKAKIIGFEPDPGIFTYLQKNIQANRIEGVTVHMAALASDSGTGILVGDGKYGSSLALNPDAVGPAREGIEVSCVRLADYLDEPIDLLKMNIEGVEWPVLKDTGDRLRLVRQMIIEYHHLPGLPRTLHEILGLLDRLGFEVMINDFDIETNPGVAPPFRLDRDTRYFLLIYARRKD